MTIVTHIVATAVGIKALNLHGRDAVLAWIFGLGQDIDHLIKLPFYLRAVGLKNKKGYYWRSSLQEPVALLWILPICLLLQTWVPAIFFAIHLALDYSVGYEKMPLYPYSPHITRGWITKFPDAAKEIAALAVLGCTSLLLR
ncbi:MAG: hypothetical protein HY700_02580 [Gemmatimonadetes bacterium]|nr:hypothetical protein [Gemmatimonadota bacterium]